MDFGLILLALKSIDELAKAAGSIKGGSGLEKHVNFLRDQLRAVGEAQAKEEKENASLKEKVAELEAELARKWLPFRGGLFLRLASGRIDHAVYCPACKASTIAQVSSASDIRMGSDPNSMFGGRFRCVRIGCGWESGFIGDDMATLINAVTLEYGTDPTK